MTLAQLITSTRYLVKENSTDSGALLSDTGNLLDFLYDAAEQVVLDLCPIMPGQFMVTEDITLVAGTQNYTLTNEYLMVYKVERNVTGKTPREITIIDPLEQQFYMNVGDTEAEPSKCYFKGNQIYFVKKPSAAYANFAKVYLIIPEAAAIPVAGPTYIPRIAHRLIVYWAASLCAAMMQLPVSNFLSLYHKKLEEVKRVWAVRFQSQPRFVRDSVYDRSVVDEREKAFNDLRWRD